MQHFYTADKTYVLDGGICYRILNVEGKVIKHAPGTGCSVLGAVLENTDRTVRLAPIPLVDLAPDAFKKRKYCLVLKLRPREAFVTDAIITKPVDARTAGKPSIHPNAPKGLS